METIPIPIGHAPDQKERGLWGREWVWNQKMGQLSILRILRGNTDSENEIDVYSVSISLRSSLYPTDQLVTGGLSEEKWSDIFRSNRANRKECLLPFFFIFWIP